jgi:hypothetical protein
MPPVGFETTIPASARPQTYALERAATGIGPFTSLDLQITFTKWAVIPKCFQARNIRVYKVLAIRQTSFMFEVTARIRLYPPLCAYKTVECGVC